MQEYYLEKVKDTERQVISYVVHGLEKDAAFGTREEREEIGAKIEAYLKSKYPNWDKENLIYRR